MRYDPEKFKAESATHYQKLLEGVKGPLTHEKALELHNEANKRTLDDIASSVDVDGLVEELTNPENTQYFHMGEGMFMFYKRNGKRGELVIPPKGDLSHHPGLKKIEPGCIRRTDVSEEHDRKVQSRELDHYSDEAYLMRNKSRLLYRDEAWPDIEGKSRKDWAYDPSGENNFEITVIGSKLGSSYAFRAYWGNQKADNRSNCFSSYILVIPTKDNEDKILTIADNPEILIQCFKAVYEEFDDSTPERPLRIRQGPKGVVLRDLPAA